MLFLFLFFVISVVTAKMMMTLFRVRTAFVLFFFLLLLLLLHRFGHELLESHEITLLIGIPLGLGSKCQLGRKANATLCSTHLLVDRAAQNQGVGALNPLLQLDGLIVQDLVTDIAQNSLDLES